MTIVATSIGKYQVKESLEEVTKMIKDKDFCILTLSIGQSIAINSKHIVYIKE
jgi:hypothetical protein